MAEHEHSPLDHPEIQSSSTVNYLIAFVIAMVFMVVSCVLTVGIDMSSLSTIIWIGVIALIATIAQLYLLFKLDLSKTMIWHTVSAIATIPLFFISITLTMWMFHYLQARVMIDGG